MIGHQPRFDRLQLGIERLELARQHLDHVARQGRHTRLSGQAPQQLADLRGAFWRGDAELGGMAADRVDQHRALLDQQIAHAEHRQRRLALGGLDRHKPHARPAHRFANRRRVDCVVLAAFDIEPAPAKAGGLMYCGGISITSWPSRRRTRAQWCEAPHASMPIRVAGCLANNFSTSLRRIWRRNTGCSVSSTP
jgi:hypothetical protein